MKSKMTLDKIAEIAGNHGVGSPDHFTCLIRISLNLKNDQKNRPHDPDAALATMPDYFTMLLTRIDIES